MTLPALNPLKWGRPVQVIAALALLVIGYSAVTGGVASVWAKYLTNKTLRGIASQISDIDKVEQDSNEKEQAVEALGRQAQELQQKVTALEVENTGLKQKLQVSSAVSAQAGRKLADLRTTASKRTSVKTLDQALVAIQRALADHP